MKYQFIEKQCSAYPVCRMCAALEVSSSGYYAWRDRSPSQRKIENREIAKHMHSIHAKARHTYSSPRIHAKLLEKGWQVSRGRVQRLGQRVSQEVSSVVTQYLLDTQPGLFKVLQADDGTQVNRFVHDQRGVLSHQDDGSDWNWLVSDGLGSVRGVYDDDLAQVYAADFDPYGNVIADTGSNPTNFGYPGEWTDQNGLVHLRARYYDPVLGSFFNLDPLETANRYGYTSGNPTNLVDPSGLYTPSLPMGFGGVCQTDDTSCENPAGQSMPWPAKSLWPEDTRVDLLDYARQLDIWEKIGASIPTVPFVSYPIQVWGHIFSLIGYDVAGSNWTHYFTATGTPVQANVNEMLRELPNSFTRHVQTDLQQSLLTQINSHIQQNWNNSCMSFQITPQDGSTDYWTRVDTDRVLEEDFWNWGLGMGGFNYTFIANVSITPQGEVKTCYRIYIVDVYDWNCPPCIPDVVLSMFDITGTAEGFDIKGRSSEICFTYSYGSNPASIPLPG